MKLDRLLGIVHVLANTERTTARELARRFEVSLRTIHRDVEAICLAGIPVVTYPGGNGGIGLTPGYKLDRKALTQTELGSILTGLRGLESVGYDEQPRQLRNMLEPVGQDVLSPAPDLYIDLASHYKRRLAPAIRTLREAIATHRAVTLFYLSVNCVSERIFEPYYIAFRWSAWYVAGWCRLRSDFRMFKINRILRLEETAETYSFRDLPLTVLDPDRMFHQEHPETVVLLVHASAEYRLLDEFGPDSYTREDSGWLRFSFPFVNKEWILNFVFSLADKARVLAPETLVQTIRARAQTMAALYEIPVSEEENSR